MSWNSIAGHLSIDHPATVADYVELLETMVAVYIQRALREDKITSAPKKANKFVSLILSFTMLYVPGSRKSIMKITT